ncbi:hypothetical protein BDR26DRAFT_936881 [Obelidium mucronatum]|nr:hypothetical protein BDR26DRAFT_936881 [Obelidium mucronatum]
MPRQQHSTSTRSLTSVGSETLESAELAFPIDELMPAMATRYQPGPHQINTAQSLHFLAIPQPQPMIPNQFDYQEPHQYQQHHQRHSASQYQSVNPFDTNSPHSFKPFDKHEPQNVPRAPFFVQQNQMDQYWAAAAPGLGGKPSYPNSPHRVSNSSESLRKKRRENTTVLTAEIAVNGMARERMASGGAVGGNVHQVLSQKKNKPGVASPISAKHQRPNSRENEGKRSVSRKSEQRGGSVGEDEPRIINGPSSLVSKSRTVSRQDSSKFHKLPASKQPAIGGSLHPALGGKIEKGVMGGVKQGRHYNNYTHKHRQTQHPPEFVVRHVNEKEIYPSEMEKPELGVAAPLVRRKTTSNSPKSPRGHSFTSGASGAGKMSRSDKLDDKENESYFLDNVNPEVARKVQKFEHQKSDILRYIQRIKSQYARHISSPYRRSPIPHASAKFASATKPSPHGHERPKLQSQARKTPSPRKAKNAIPLRISVRPSSPLKKHQNSSPGSHIPILSLNRLNSPKRPKSRVSFSPMKGNGKEDTYSTKDPFVPSLIRDVKRAFPPLEPEQNPRRKRFRVEMEKAWAKSLAEGLAEDATTSRTKHDDQYKQHHHASLQSSSSSMSTSSPNSPAPSVSLSASSSAESISSIASSSSSNSRGSVGGPPVRTPVKAPNTPKQSAAKKTPNSELKWEFAAPKYVDFDALNAEEEELLSETGLENDSKNPWSNVQKQEKADAWFGATRVARPSALLDQLEMVSEADSVDDDAPTPKASRVHNQPRPKTAGPVRPSTAASSSTATIKSQKPPARPATASHATTRTTTSALHGKTATTSTDIAKMFNQLSLQSNPVVRRVASDPEAKARLLEGTAASKARATTSVAGSESRSMKGRAASAPGNLNRGGASATSTAVRKGPTVPKEFSFTKRTPFRAKSPGIKSLADAEKSPFIPLVNRVKQFEQHVPDRFKPLPKATTRAQLAGQMMTRLTKPHSPMLRTKNRAKPQATKTTEEIQLEEIAKAPRFKAQPVNKKILKEPHIGAPPPTKPALTVPKSPHFSKLSRSASSVPTRPASPPKIIKANPIRYAGTKPFEPVLEHRQILPGEVHLPGEEMRLKKLREFEDSLKRQQQEEERKREFHANPVPDLSAVDPLPEVKPRPPTEPEPFHLLTHSLQPRSAFQGSAFDIASQDLVPGTKFVAQPVPMVEPFVPKKSSKPPTLPEPILLHTDCRVEERRMFEEAKREREREEDELRELARLEREELERQEVRRLRQEQVFQAQPVRQFPGIQIHASQRRLTEPESPMLKDKRERLARLRTKMMNINSPRRRHLFADGEGSTAVAAEREHHGAETSDVQYFEVKEIPGSSEDEEFDVPHGEFEVIGVERNAVSGSARSKKEWAAPVEWVDSDGVATSGGFEVGNVGLVHFLEVVFSKGLEVFFFNFDKNEMDLN